MPPVLCLLPQVQSFKDDPLIFKGNLRAQTGNELLKVRQEDRTHVCIVAGL